MLIFSKISLDPYRQLIRHRLVLQMFSYRTCLVVARVFLSSVANAFVETIEASLRTEPLVAKGLCV